MAILGDRMKNANETDKCGETPLMKAAGRGHAEVVKILLEREADVTVKSKSGKTVLPYANGNSEIKDLLIRHGAKEPEKPTRTGRGRLC